MARPKGSPKLGGRKKGTPNKDKKRIREAVESLLDSVDVVGLYEEQTTPKDKASLLLGLMEFSIPKLGRTDVDLTTGGKEINVKPKEWTK